MTVTRRRRFLFLSTALIAVNSFFWIAQSGFALPQSIINQFFGGRMIRSEVLISTPAGTQDWRIDRGVITAISGTAVTLLERDATVVSLQIDPNARVQGPLRFASVGQLRRRLRVVIYRQADQPATLVQVEGPSG
jgi:hypothetical protein